LHRVIKDDRRRRCRMIAPSKGQKQPEKGRRSSSVWDPKVGGGVGRGIVTAAKPESRMAGIPLPEVSPEF